MTVKEIGEIVRKSRKEQNLTQPQLAMACGTGACASVAAAVSKGLCPFGEAITVHLDGGDLCITVDEGFSVTMTGPAETVYEGEVQL